MSASNKNRLRRPCVSCGNLVEDRQTFPFPGHQSNCLLAASWKKPGDFNAQTVKEIHLIVGHLEPWRMWIINKLTSLCFTLGAGISWKP